MKEFNVPSLPLKDVIRDLAENMDTDFTTDCDEYTVVIPPNYGEGKIVGINFDGGLGLLIYRCTFKRDVEIHFTANKVHPLKFLYCLEGSVNHRFEKEKTDHELGRFQNSIVASSQRDGHIMKFKKDQTSIIYGLEVDRKTFKSTITCELGKARPNLQQIFEDDTAQNSFYYNGLYSLSLADIFDEMEARHYDNLIGKLFTEYQCYRMLTQQLIQFHDDNGDEERMSLKKTELTAIMEAAAIMRNELETLGTMSSLAKRVGLNNDKFQNGFKLLFNKTANEYVQHLRLNLAKELLLTTDLDIQEIKNQVGFSSHSYFSYLFKNTYNVSPSYFRKSQKKQGK